VINIVLGRHKRFTKLHDGDCVAVVEACSHVPTCDDIGRVKIPRWIEEKLHIKLQYKFSLVRSFLKQVAYKVASSSFIVVDACSPGICS